jgi:membrane-anchored protein YejM (alkaline phosphatase superfamily)
LGWIIAPQLHASTVPKTHSKLRDLRLTVCYIHEQLEEIGELDNTIVVVTSDNGMPVPRCKTTLYDWGVRMPMAIRWNKIPPNRTIDDFVLLTDLAPTFLEAGGLPIPERMTGKSLLSMLTSSQRAYSLFAGLRSISSGGMCFRTRSRIGCKCFLAASPCAAVTGDSSSQSLGTLNSDPSL